MRYLEKLNEDFGLWLEKLSERERKLLWVFFCVIILGILTLTIYGATSKISQKKALLRSSQEKLSKIRDLEDDYKKAKREIEKAKQKIKKNKVFLSSLVSNVSTKLNLTVKDLNEQRKPIPKTDIVQVEVKLNLSKLSIDRLTALIENLETSDESGDLVKVTKIKINKRFDDPELLDLQMTVATWKST